MSVSILQKDSGKRMEYAAKVLERAGFEVHSDGNSADFDAILLPPPSKRFILGDSGLFNDLRSGYGGIVFVGSSAEWFRNELRYAVTVDYSLDVNYSEINNKASCEGALSLIIGNTPFNLSSSKVLVSGYGRLAKELARMLLSLGAEVTVCCRNINAREEAEKSGCRAIGISSIESGVLSSDIIINTVPARIFPDYISVLEGKYFFELASEPFGFDREVYSLCGGKCLYAPSIPDRFSPLSSGTAIAEAVIGYFVKP